MDPSAPRGSPSRPLPSSHDSNNNNNNNSSSEDHSQQRVRFSATDSRVSSRFYQPTLRRDRSPAAASSAALPSVYWDNKKNNRDIDVESDANLAGYTFYREPTPPPPENEASEKRFGHGGSRLAAFTDSSTAGGGTIRSDGDYSHRPLNTADTANWSAAAEDESIPPRMRKKVLWATIVAGVLILIGVAVGVGVGLGVGLKASGGEAEPINTNTPSSTIPNLGPNSSPAPTEPPSTIHGGTGAAADATTGSAPAPRPTYNSDCPALNNTIYNVPGSTKSFRRICGVDYSGRGATDLVHTWTDSLATCMDSCASLDQCTGCAWGYLEGDKGEKHRCYMKKDLKRAHQAARDWCFAILE
ncbi:hypothetical protein C7999DRAFT_14303 [Corynascus novoguineensis]|uniref:Apple domain-containing protein n=1 Tax=Corynascus novoguineensis TaxID=1126955 RepID=A0AAN7HNX0_9PEZI|nr:hypothetical protein C7999DRAFT_14303 [Corynascus novoguineensis]